MSKEGVTNYLFEYFGAKGEKRNSTVVARILFVAFFVDRNDVGVFPESGEHGLVDR